MRACFAETIVKMRNEIPHQAIKVSKSIIEANIVGVINYSPLIVMPNDRFELKESEGNLLADKESEVLREVHN